MALTVGSRLGHYDVTAQIGAGGMGPALLPATAKCYENATVWRFPQESQVSCP